MGEQVMRSVYALVAVGFILALPPLPRLSAQQDAAAADQAVRETVARLVAAYGENDLDTYFSFFADDMTVWWGTSGRNDRPTPKAQYVKSWPEFVKKTGGHETCRLADLRIQVGPSADAAVSSYELSCVFRKPPPGGNPDATYEITSVLFKRNGLWKVIHFNWREREPDAARVEQPSPPTGL
jgi:ketosteroid isomerase-like protein